MPEQSRTGPGPQAGALVTAPPRDLPPILTPPGVHRTPLAPATPRGGRAGQGLCLEPLLGWLEPTNPAQAIRVREHLVSGDS